MVQSVFYPLNSVNFQALARLRHTVLVICALVFGFGLSNTSWASTNGSTTELLMIDSDYCPYCRKFDREIAEIYPKTEEGRRAPLVRHKLGDKLPKKYSGLDITPRTITPTFILLENNKEVDRLLGYNNDEFFWYLLNDLLNKLQTQ